MKAKIYELFKLASFIIGTLCVVGIVALVVSVLADMISVGWFIFWLVVDAVIMTLISMYIENHFVDGEWL